MTGTKHTASPTPWTIELDETCKIRDADGGSVAQLHFTGKGGKFGGRRPHEEVVANARLIASAPALLEALKEITTWVDNWDPEFTDDDEWPGIRHFKGIIELAEGKQP